MPCKTFGASTDHWEAAMTVKNPDVEKARLLVERLQRMDRHAEVTKELQELFDSYDLITAEYGTAVILHDLDPDCDCGDCKEFQRIKDSYA